MEFKEYSTIANRTINQRGEKLLLNAALGLCGEAGETADLIKKHLFQGHPLDRSKIANELGDVLWYVNAMAESIDLTLEDVAVMNNHKLTARYPNGFRTEDSLNRRIENEEYDLPQRGRRDAGRTVED